MAVHFCPALDGHLGDQLPDVQVELRRTRRDIDAEHGEVQRISLGAEPHTVLHHRAVRAEQRRRRCGPGEGDGVLLGQQVEQAPRSAGDQLQAALGQQPGGDDLLDHGLGQVGRLRRGLHHGRHAGQERRGQLFQHPPDREVERVDLQGDAAARRVDVLADELPGAAESFHRPVDEHRGVGQFPAALAGIGEQHPDAAVDVDDGIPLRGTGPRRDGIELFAFAVQVGGQRLERQGPLVKGHVPQRWSTNGSRMIQHGHHVDRVGADDGHRFSGGGVEQFGPFSGRTLPAACDIAFDEHRHGVTPGAGAAGFGGGALFVCCADG